MMATPNYPPEWWLTVPEICADLRITPQELADWASNGLAPVPELAPDGIGRIHRADFETWLDHMSEDNTDTGDSDR